MALILNIETATRICSVCLAQDGHVLDMKESSEEKSHASLTGIFINELLKKNDFEIKQLDAVAISKGPGSYTGLRIGVSVAKGICYGASIPLIGINTLQSLSWDLMENIQNKYDPWRHDIWLCPMIDARRMEAYTAFYDVNYDLMRPVSADIITSESYHDILSIRKIIFFGSGINKCKDLIQHPNALFIDNIFASSSKMAFFAEESFLKKQFENLAYFEPFYLKDFQTTIPKNKIVK